MAIKSTLSETKTELRKALFAIMSGLDPDNWKFPGQIIYSTKDEWITAQEAFVVFNKELDVKFPFASLTRMGFDGQDSYKLWNQPFIAREDAEENSSEVKIARVRPVRLKYNFTIYDNRNEDIDAFADLVIIDGQEEQRHNYHSVILNQPTRLGIIMEEPKYIMIPDREEKRDQKGHIYGLTIPLIVDTVLGLPGSKNIIRELVCNIGIVKEIKLEMFPDDIIDT